MKNMICRPCSTTFYMFDSDHNSFQRTTHKYSLDSFFFVSKFIFNCYKYLRKNMLLIVLIYDEKAFDPFVETGIIKSRAKFKKTRVNTYLS